MFDTSIAETMTSRTATSGPDETRGCTTQMSTSTDAVTRTASAAGGGGSRGRRIEVGVASMFFILVCVQVVVAAGAGEGPGRVWTALGLAAVLAGGLLRPGGRG